MQLHIIKFNMHIPLFSSADFTSLIQKVNKTSEHISTDCHRPDMTYFCLCHTFWTFLYSYINMTYNWHYAFNLFSTKAKEMITFPYLLIKFVIYISYCCHACACFNTYVYIYIRFADMIILLKLRLATNCDDNLLRLWRLRLWNIHETLFATKELFYWKLR